MAIDWTSMTDDEVWAEVTAGMTEQSRRISLTRIPSDMDKMNSEYLIAQGVQQGDPWVQPEGAHNAYPKDWVVTHDGKTWESIVFSNVWTPPTNWREVSGPQYPEWVQPSGAVDAYNTGDRVSFEGLCYESLIDANVWSPTEYPTGWQEISCVAI